MRDAGHAPESPAVDPKRARLGDSLTLDAKRAGDFAPPARLSRLNDSG